MKKFRIYFIASIIAIFSIIAVGCSSSSPEKVLENAINKNKEIKYSKQNADISIGLAGMTIDLKASGDVDNKDKKAALKVSINAPMAQMNNETMDIYTDKGVTYIKEPGTDKFMKMTAKEGTTSDSSVTEGIAAAAFSSLKDDKSLKDSIKIEKDSESNQVINAEISKETVKGLVDKMLASEDVMATIQSAIESQLMEMSEGVKGNTKSKEEMQNLAKQGAKDAVEEYKNTIKQLEISSIKYTGKVNKDGYLYSEEISFDIKEATSGLTLNLKLNTNISDINADKTVNIPEIPADKIVEM